MLRSHRLLRNVHRFRVSRRVRAGADLPFDAVAEVMEAGPDLRLLEADRHLPEADLDAFTLAALRRIAELVRAARPSPLSACVAGIEGVTGRRRSGRFATAPADPRVALLAATLIDERVLAAAAQVLRWLALDDHAQRAAWPASYADQGEGRPGGRSLPSDPAPVPGPRGSNVVGGGVVVRVVASPVV